MPFLYVWKWLDCLSLPPAKSSGLLAQVEKSVTDLYRKYIKSTYLNLRIKHTYVGHYVPLRYACIKLH